MHDGLFSEALQPVVYDLDEWTLVYLALLRGDLQ